MSNKNILSIAVVIFACTLLIHGYPKANADIGPTISSHVNPLVYATGTSSGTLFSAPNDQIIVISDIILTASGANGWQPCVSSVELSTSSGAIAYFQMTSDSTANEGSSHSGSTVSHSFSGGIPVPEGEQVSISIGSGCTVNYVISGYHAHP